MASVLNIEDFIPHICQETICVKCLCRWIDVRPRGVMLKNIECPNCKNSGFVIGTGEEVFNMDGEIIE